MRVIHWNDVGEYYTYFLLSKTNNIITKLFKISGLNSHE